MCKLINALDQMGPFHILLEEMRSDQMRLDKVGRPFSVFISIMEAYDMKD